MSEKFNIVVLCSEYEPVFNYNALKLLCQDEQIQIGAMVIDTSTESVSVSRVIRYLKKRGFPRTLYRALSKLLPGDLGYRIEFGGTHKSRRLLPVSNLNINCKKIITDNILSSEVVAKVKAMNLEVIARLSGGGIVREPWLSMAKYGVFSYHHDDLTKIRGGPPCFWEYYYHSDTQGVTIQRLNEGLDTGPIVMQRFYPIDYSVGLNKFFDRVMLESADMMLLSIKKVLEHNLDLEFDHEIGRYYTAPGVLALIRMSIVNIKIHLKHYFKVLSLLC